MTPRIIGVAYLAAYVTGILGIVLSGLFDPSFTATQDLLVNVFEKSVRIKISILCDFIATASVVVLATSLFSVLKNQNRLIALFGLGCWFLYMAVGLSSRISVFSLLQLSKEYTEAGSVNTGYFSTLGSLSAGAANSGYLILSLFFRLGGLAFYYLFFTSRLIPRFLSIWGLGGIVLGLIQFFMEFFDYYPVDPVFFSIPNVVFEPFIGIWLIVKGFNKSAVTKGFSEGHTE